MRAWMRTAVAVPAIAVAVSAGTALASSAAPAAPAVERIVETAADGQRLCTNGSGHRGCTPPLTGSIAVSIPAVSFTESVVVKGGHLRTPVLLADDTVTARVRVVGAATGPGCTAELLQGVPAWLDCSISSRGKGNPRIVVRLSDGRTAMKEITYG